MMACYIFSHSFTGVLLQNFESQLQEAKNKKEISVSEAVEKALASRMQDIQSKLDQCVVQKKTVADVSPTPPRVFFPTVVG